MRARERDTHTHREREGEERERRGERERDTHTHTQRERERERQRGDESCVCEPASAPLSLQARRLSYFNNSDFTHSLQRNITLRVSLLKLFMFPCCVRCAISDICVH